MQDTKTASFLLVNYKSSKNINRLVAEINKNISYPFEILIFDNSNDLKLENSKLNVFSVNKNIGFGSAIDYLATKAKYNYLFVLNPDVSLVENLDSVLEKIVDLPLEYAVFSLNKSEILYKIPFFGRFLNFEKRFSSNAFVVGSEYFKTLGGFNPEYFMYFEDNEFALELKKFSLKTFYPQKPFVVHTKNYSYKEGLIRKSMYYESFLYFLKNNYKISYFLFFIPLKLALVLSKIFK